MGLRPPILIPDTDGDLILWLDRLEELLISLTAVADDLDRSDPAPAPLGDGAALAALQRLSSAVHEAERANTPTLIAPDGRFELVPLHLVRVEPADVATVARTIAILGRAGGDEAITDVLADHAARYRTDVPDLVAACTRALTLLDQSETDDAATLAAAIAGRHSRVVLTTSEHNAYLRVTEDHLAGFHLNDPLAHFLYRGCRDGDSPPDGR